MHRCVQVKRIQKEAMKLYRAGMECSAKDLKRKCGFQCSDPTIRKALSSLKARAQFRRCGFGVVVP